MAVGGDEGTWQLYKRPSIIGACQLSVINGHNLEAMRKACITALDMSVASKWQL